MSSPAELKLPSPEAMTQDLAKDLPGFVVPQWVEQAASTNASLLALAREKGTHAGWPRLLGTHHQTHGKGRLGRSWQDLPGQTLMFSCGFALGLAAKELSALQGLGPALGLQSALALRSLMSAPDRLTVKWPNDLMVDDGKCAGILIELAAAGRDTVVIVGIGINLSGHQKLENDLCREIGEIGSLMAPATTASLMVSALANAWRETLQTITSEGFEPFRSAYANLDYLAGQDVKILDQGRVIATGLAAGLGPDGSLGLMTEQGLQTFHVGDVSARLSKPVGQT